MMLPFMLFWSLTMTGYYHCGSEGFFGNGGCHYANVDGVASPEVGITIDANVRITALECTTSGALSCAKAFELFTDRNITPKPCITNWTAQKNEACRVEANALLTKGSRVMMYTFVNAGECPEDAYVSCRVSGVRVP